MWLYRCSLVEAILILVADRVHSGTRRPVRPGRGAPIMTDFADRVEQVRVAVLGYGSQVEEDSPFWTRVTTGGSPCRRALARPASESWRAGNGGETATAAVGIGWIGALPPPMNDSAGTTAAFRPSSIAEDRRELLGTRRQARDGRGDHRPERDSLGGSIGVETPAAAWPRARPASSCRGARRASSGSASTRPIACLGPDHDAALRAAQQLVAREQHEIGPGGDRRRRPSARRRPGAAGPARAHRSRCRRSSRARGRGRAAPGLASSGVLGEADDPEVAAMDPQDRGRLRADGALVVRQPGLVGRADLAEPGPRDLEDLGEPEAAADLDELAARDDHLSPGRQGLAEPAPSPRRCCSRPSRPRPRSARRAAARSPTCAGRACRLPGRAPGCNSPEPPAATAAMASSASGARPSPVCSKIPVALITGRRSARRLSRISRDRCARLAGSAATASPRKARTALPRVPPEPRPARRPGRGAQGRREQLVFQARCRPAATGETHRDPRSLCTPHGRAGTVNVRERIGSFWRRTPLSGECSRKPADHFHADQAAGSQFGDSGHSSYTIIQYEHAVGPLVNPGWLHTCRRTAKEGELSCQFTRVGALAAGRRNSSSPGSTSRKSRMNHHAQEQVCSLVWR